MDINKLKPIKFDGHTYERILCELFPDMMQTLELNPDSFKLSDKEFPIHAGAFALYAAMLTTKIYENNPMALEPEFTDRAKALKTLLRQQPAYMLCSEQQINDKVLEIIKKDIRNSFAHGNFAIDYNIYTKKLYYVLTPRRKDYITPEPIVISGKTAFNAVKKHLSNISSLYSVFLNPANKHNINVDSSFMRIVLPTFLLKLADFYLNNAPQEIIAPLKNNACFKYLDYALLATKITYEQDDYYNLFGKTSNIFNVISLIRNSLAHDNVSFENNASSISYTDNSRNLTESVIDSITKLHILNNQKEILLEMKSKHSDLAISSLTDVFKDLYDFFFANNTYSLQDFADAIAQDEEDIINK